MNDGLDYAKENKKIIMNTLLKDLEKYKRYLNYLNLNPENFSKSLQIDLNNFIADLKFNTSSLTCCEKEGLILIRDINNNNLLNNNHNESSDQLDILLNELETMKEKLKFIREKMNQTSQIKNSKEDLIINNQENYNFELTYKKIQRILNNRNRSEEPRLEISNDELLNIKKYKNESSELNQNNRELKDLKEKLENKMKSYCNLPADIERIKEMIRQKRNEYDEL